MKQAAMAKGVMVIMTVIFFCITVFVLVINSGRFFDVTQRAHQADVIVALGGGDRERIDKAAELYKSGYATKIIVTGNSKMWVGDAYVNKMRYLSDKGVQADNIIFLSQTSNTMKEVLRVKEYLLAQHLHRVLFVSDPPHARRIMTLAQSLARYQDDGLSCSVVSSGVLWWDRKSFYHNRKAIRFVLSEAIKLPSNYIAYGILKPLGLYDVLRGEFGDVLRYLKYKIQGILG